MYLEKIVILNNRSCKKVVLDLNNEAPVTLIGFNDSGKTVILKSIGCLLNSEKLDISGADQISSDISNTRISKEEFDQIFINLKLPAFNYNPDSIVLLGILKMDSNEITEDFLNNATPHLQWSLDNNKKIFLLKYYTKDNAFGKYYLCVPDKKSDNLSLWNQTKSFLDGKIKDLGITNEDITNVNLSGPFKNIEKFRAIYDKLEISDVWSEYAYNKDKSYFPTYRYLDWNITMKDISGLAKDVMSGRIGPFKDKLAENANSISIEVNEEVNKELKSKTKSLFSDLPNIESLEIGVRFKVDEEISDIVIKKNECDGKIAIESQGDGVKKQIWLAFIKWQSLQSLPEESTIKKYIWCFDEPEVHLYPSAQRLLFEIIKKVGRGAVQVIVSTHSTIFIDRVGINDIYQTSLVDSYSTISNYSSIDDIHSALGVKNSDILFFDKFFAVEGTTDKYLIPYFYKLFFNKSVIEDNIQIIDLNGSGNKDNNKKMFESIMSNFRKQSDMVIYFLDGDTSASGDNVCLIGKYDIEDSLDNSIWINLIKGEYNINITEKVLEEIRSNMSIEQHKKFHTLLSNWLFEANKNYLPSKGKLLAMTLMRYITNKEQIPSEIINTFKSLQIN